jgi:hypothetical protein
LAGIGDASPHPKVELHPPEDVHLAHGRQLVVVEPFVFADQLVGQREPSIDRDLILLHVANQHEVNLTGKISG